MQAWLSQSLQRNYPNSEPALRTTLSLAAARGERLSFQASVYFSDGNQPRAVDVEIESPDHGVSAFARRVGMVPVPHHNSGTSLAELDGVGLLPGYVPDPLYPETRTLAAPLEVSSFWITVCVGADAKPGKHEIVVTLKTEGGSRSGGRKLRATIQVFDVTLKPRHNFPVTHWFYADALCDRYGLEPFEKDFWPLAEKYMRNCAEHGQDVLYVPVFTPPLDGVKRPTQLLKVTRTGKDKYRFDWANVRRWIRTARSVGIQRFEWTHFFTQWGCRNAIRIYERQDGGDVLLWPPETEATSETYRRFLSQFLPALHRFLTRENLLDCSYFHVSDEPGGDSLPHYREARGMLRELAPWMEVMDALSDVRFAQDGVTDMPVSSIAHAREFRDAGIPCWAYYCCGPRGRYVNRLLDTPLHKVRITGWLLYRLEMRGFLHWGYNYWYRCQTREMIDPFTVTDAHNWPGWAYGDPFVVYPGPDGPIDSVRWEVFAEGLQDYALLQTLGVAPDSRALGSLEDFDEFPRDDAWVLRTRTRLLSKA